MKTYGGREILIHVFITLELNGGKWSASHPGHLTPEETESGTHWIGDWVDPRADMDAVKSNNLLLLLGNKSLIPCPSSL
jgi:hypothetical protein